MYTLGRIHIPDQRDENYQIKTLLAATTPKTSLPLHRYWWDSGWWGDQGEKPWCVAYSWLHWLEDGPTTQPGKGPIVLPVDVYEEAQQVDEWPGESYDGTSVRAGAKVLQSKGFIKSYHWAWDIDTAINAILTLGPIVVGTNWYSQMFYPDSEDRIRIGGVLAGGHAYVINGVNLKKGTVRIKNSWGRSWGGDGRVSMSIEDFEKLIHEDGEVCLAQEIRKVS